MRIKKKHILTEALLIDTTSEFTPYEKKIFKIFHKKYGIGGYGGDFDRWVGAAWLIEHMGFDHDDAYDMSLTYWYNGDKLFKDSEPLRRKESRGYLFSKLVQDFSDPFKDSISPGDNSIIGNWDINWYDANNLLDKGQNFKISSPVNIWTGYRGFTLYIPFEDRWYSHVSYEFKETMTLMGRIQYSEVPTTKKYESEQDPEDEYNKFYYRTMEVEQKNINGEPEKVLTTGKTKIKIPNKLSKDIMFDIFQKDIDELKELVVAHIFKLPEEDKETV